MRRAAALAALVLAVACGSDDRARFGGSAETSPPPAGGGLPGGAANISLTVRLQRAPGEPVRVSELDCNPAPHGTGAFDDRTAAENACHFLIVDAGAQKRLRDGPEPGRICTEIYGGPELAEVVGQLYGEPVDAKFNRTDGCGIGEWDRFDPLLDP